MKIAKMGSRIVEIVRVTDTVAFSTAQGWIFVNMDFERPRHRQMNLKWVPATTRFEWVREFRGLWQICNS